MSNIDIKKHLWVQHMHVAMCLWATLSEHQEETREAATIPRKLAFIQLGETSLCLQLRSVSGLNSVRRIKIWLFVLPCIYS